MKRSSRIIRHPAELGGLSALPGLRMPGSGRIRLEPGEGLDPETAAEYERRLNADYFACGCEKAAFGMLAGLVGYLGWIATRAEGWGDVGWGEAGFGLAVVLVTTFAGKLAGRAAADRRLRRTIAELRMRWRAPPWPSGEILSCG